MPVRAATVGRGACRGGVVRQVFDHGFGSGIAYRSASRIGSVIDRVILRGHGSTVDVSVRF
ncbi:hypothetical protein GCM10023167_10480 [Brevibacterium pityocampae]|uniref:Uncharacterized protein n=1 Tax=Brevibacterium pityocampae TaxID=506594 RepID=A0ABP8J8Q8_9MICO